MHNAHQHLFHRLELVLAVAMVLSLLIGLGLQRQHAKASADLQTAHVVAKPAAKKVVAATPSPVEPTPAPVPTPVVVPPPVPVQPTNPAADCSDNTLSKLVIVSVSARHLWACESKTPVYSSPVITGMDFLAADLTPRGTFHVYSKQTNLYLKGSDSTGSWNDYVNYWMPYLYNQYGTYGFHDATWRDDSAFGNVSPDSSDASHGCVELPLATAAWLYGWAPIGTTLTVEN